MLPPTCMIAKLCRCVGLLDLIGAASHMASSRADAIKTHCNDSEMVRQMSIYGPVVEPLKEYQYMDKWRLVSRRTIERAFRSLAASSQILVKFKTLFIIFRLQVFTKYQIMSDKLSGCLLRYTVMCFKGFFVKTFMLSDVFSRQSTTESSSTFCCLTPTLSIPALQCGFFSSLLNLLNANTE
ncbi:hypothetical protein OUZ56_024819 [Daphnia magna]|uniref:Uncharacterized protein n=1 Tax=Daphnia magna TaxID=35525 RepID=A0ABQ9ZJI5_9CRUS|nr:hypothetical protein OUZ56_024819 [Daphnia magna]